jgi:hypothetical protein
MKELITKLTKLIDVKSIVTLSLTIGFLILVGKGLIDGREFMGIYTMIMGFYFGTQSNKASKGD